MIIPQLLILYWLEVRGVTELKTENSGLYMGILRAYVNVEDVPAWHVLVNTGGLYSSQLTQRMWYRFYQHAKPHSMTDNLLKFGARPVGFPDRTVPETQK